MTCTHDVVYGGLCALCGADVEQDVQTTAQPTGQLISQSAIQAQLHALFDQHDPNELQTQAVQQIHPCIVQTVNSNNQSQTQPVKKPVKQPVAQSSDASHRALVVGSRTLHLTNEAFNTQIAANTRRLIDRHKLLLVLDLDHTLLHTTDDARVASVMSMLDRTDTFGFTLPLPANQINNQAITSSNPSRRPPSVQHHFVKLRPHTKHFLSSLSDLYDLTVYTMGSRPYAESVMGYLDADRSLTKGRVCTRSETTDISFKALERLYACDSSLCGIVDDRVDVWREKHANVCRVWEFRYWGTHDVYDRNKQHQAGDTPDAVTPSLPSSSTVNDSKTATNEPSSNAPLIATPLNVAESTPYSDEITSADVTTPLKQLAVSSNTETTVPDSLTSPTHAQTHKSPIAKTSPITSNSPNKSPIRRRAMPRKPVPLFKSTEASPPASSTDVVTAITDSVTSVVINGSSSSKDDQEEKSEKPVNVLCTQSNNQAKPTVQAPASRPVQSVNSPIRPEVRASPPPIDPSTVVLPAHTDPKQADNVLLSLLSVLKAAHTLFFQQPAIKQATANSHNQSTSQSLRLPLESDISLPSVFARIRRVVLRDCHIVFTGIIPSNVKAAYYDVGLLAKQFGACVYESMDDHGYAVVDHPTDKPIAITHVIAFREGSGKVKVAQQLRAARAADPTASKPAPFVVTLSWLYHSVTHYQHAREAHHSVSMAKQSSFDERNRGVVDARYVHHAPRIITVQQILEQVKQFEATHEISAVTNEPIAHAINQADGASHISAATLTAETAAAPRTSTIKRKKAKPPAGISENDSKRIKS